MQRISLDSVSLLRYTIAVWLSTDLKDEAIDLSLSLSKSSRLTVKVYGKKTRRTGELCPATTRWYVILESWPYSGNPPPFYSHRPSQYSDRVRFSNRRPFIPTFIIPSKINRSLGTSFRIMPIHSLHSLCIRYAIDKVSLNKRMDKQIFLF